MPSSSPSGSNLTNSPATTCLSIGGNYTYGSGLPGLPVRLKQTSSTSSSSNVNSDKMGKVCCIGLPLLKQRLGYLWEKKMFTDVTFIVGRNKLEIEAHRVILASASEIFQNLLFKEGKPLISDGKYILYENDFNEQAFEVFVKAMYTNEIPICLTLAMALEVFYATKKYEVVFLENQVLEHIRQLVTVSNVFEALRYSTVAIELTYLSPICWKIIEEQTADVLKYHMNDLDSHTFSRILERDRLSLDEVELFQIAVRWAASLCKMHGMKTTGKNKRAFMEPLLKHFRFTTMNPNQFNDIVVPSRILEVKEVQQIQNVFNKTTERGTPVLPYKSTARVNTTQLALKELESCSTISTDNSHTRDDIPKIGSDSVVITPNIGSKLYLKRGSSSRLKTKRAPIQKGR